jgi:hypothetical protein
LDEKSNLPEVMNQFAEAIIKLDKKIVKNEKELIEKKLKKSDSDIIMKKLKKYNKQIKKLSKK